MNVSEEHLIIRTKQVKDGYEYKVVKVINDKEYIQFSGSTKGRGVIRPLGIDVISEWLKSVSY